jgi:hypothetical protein
MKNLGIGDTLMKYDEIFYNATPTYLAGWQPVTENQVGHVLSEGSMRDKKFRRPSNSICKISLHTLRKVLGVGASKIHEYSYELNKVDQNKSNPLQFCVRSTDLYKIFSKEDARKIHEYCKKHELYVKDTTTCVAEQRQNTIHDLRRACKEFMKSNPEISLSIGEGERVLSREEQSMLGYSYLTPGIDTILTTDEWLSCISGKWQVLGADRCVGEICRVANAFRRKIAQATQYVGICVGHTLRAGDECKFITDEWTPVPEKYYGNTVTSQMKLWVELRRPVAAPAVQSGLYALLQEGERIIINKYKDGLQVSAVKPNVTTSTFISNGSLIKEIESLLSRLRNRS